MFTHVNLNSLFDREMKVYYYKQVLQQGINIKTMCQNCILKFRNMKSHLLQVYLGTWANIEIVNKSQVN